MEAGKTLREAREHARLSQRDVAARSGIPQSAIARIERGRVIPRVDTLNRLLAGCGASLDLRPKLGVGIDRTAMRELLKLTPDERLRIASASSRNLASFLAKVPPQLRRRA
jgi:transcriptional regulator with XRE-family HTH domain